MAGCRGRWAADRMYPRTLCFLDDFVAPPSFSSGSVVLWKSPSRHFLPGIQLSVDFPRVRLPLFPAKHRFTEFVRIANHRFPFRNKGAPAATVRNPSRFEQQFSGFHTRSAPTFTGPAQTANRKTQFLKTHSGLLRALWATELGCERARRPT